MSIPTKSEVFARMMERLRLAQEDAAMLAHLYKHDGGPLADSLSRGWLAIQEMVKKMIWHITKIAQGHLQ